MNNYDEIDIDKTEMWDYEECSICGAHTNCYQAIATRFGQTECIDICLTCSQVVEENAIQEEGKNASRTKERTGRDT